MDKRTSTPELAVAPVRGLVFAVAVVVWAGAWLATTATGGHFHASLTDALGAARQLPSHVADPAAAWHAAEVAGPVPYWAATIAVLAATLALGVAITHVST